MTREYALKLISEKSWDELLTGLKNDKIFASLIEDQIFKNLFDKYFINEFLSDNNTYTNKNSTELHAIHIFHNSSSYNFRLNENDYNKLVLRLVETTNDYNFAKELPDNPLCQQIIIEYQKNLSLLSNNTRNNYQINSNLDISKTAPSQKANITSIFKSPQELEFYQAAKEVFNAEIILPNVALSVILNSTILESLTKEEKWLFLTTTIDLVIVETVNFYPIFFFELDSKFHDDPQQLAKDKIKNRLISGEGHKLFRLRKRENKNMFETFKLLLSDIKFGNTNQSIPR